MRIAWNSCSSLLPHRLFLDWPHVLSANHQGSYYSRQAEGNRTRYTRILAPRGIIYDCNGEELANNQPVSWFPWHTATRATGMKQSSAYRNWSIFLWTRSRKPSISMAVRQNYPYCAQRTARRGRQSRRKPALPA